MNLLSDTGLELGNLNLQEECDFQAAELAGLAEISLNFCKNVIIAAGQLYVNICGFPPFKRVPKLQVSVKSKKIQFKIFKTHFKPLTKNFSVM